MSRTDCSLRLRHLRDFPRLRGLRKKCCGALEKGRGFSPAVKRAPTHSTICGQGVGTAGLKPRPSEAPKCVFPQPLRSLDPAGFACRNPPIVGNRHPR